MKRIAIVQVDVCVGDMDGNTELVLEYIARARDSAGADTVIFPELALTGYPPEDLLLRPHFHVQVEQALQRVLKATQGIDVILGYPLAAGQRLYNACSLIRDGKIVTTYHKRNLPNYGVFDEKRYFTEGTDLNLVETPDFKVALSVCEDLWTEDHAREAAQAGAELLININASPYHTDKAAVREELLRRRAADHNIAIIYVNLVGGQDELVFDGGSLVVDGSGEFVFRAPQFEQGLYLVDLERARGRPVLKARSPQPPAPGLQRKRVPGAGSRRQGLRIEKRLQGRGHRFVGRHRLGADTGRCRGRARSGERGSTAHAVTLYRGHEHRGRAGNG